VRRKLAHSRHGHSACSSLPHAARPGFSALENSPPISRGHENAVLDFADMPHEVLYDNMRMVGLERHGYGRGRHRFYAGFLDFARHCGFQPRLRAPHRAQITDVIDKRFLRRSR